MRLNPPVDRTGTRPLLAQDATHSPAAAEQLKSARVQTWRRDSLLKDLDQRQTDENRAGRRRLRDGVLTPTAATVAITPDMDLEADSFDFIYEPGFLTRAECALLAETAEALASEQHVADIKDDFWKGRILYFATSWPLGRARPR